MNKEVIQTIFNIGVFVGRDMERDFVKNYDELQRKYVNFIDWEAERMLEVLDELKIEERELSWEERVEIARKTLSKETFYEYGNLSPFTTPIITYWLNQHNIPTKIITITYKGEKKEIYE
jgi:hypothetical protein